MFPGKPLFCGLATYNHGKKHTLAATIVRLWSVCGSFSNFHQFGALPPPSVSYATLPQEPWTINSRCLEYFGAGARGVNRVCKNNSFCNFEFVSNFTNSNLVIADSVRIPAHPHQRISRYERNSFSKFVSSIGDVNS